MPLFGKQGGRDGAKSGSWVVVKPASEAMEQPWLKCGKCGRVVDAGQYERTFHVCPMCKDHGRINADQRIKLLADQDSFVEWDAKLVGDDPLDFPGYGEKLDSLCADTGLNEGVKTGCATIGGIKVALAVMDSRFMMASMGGAVGEKISRAVEQATKQQLPMVISCCSGGARMQEGLISLMQMAKVSAALKRHADAGLFYLSIITDPTTGGVTASFAMLGDVIIAEPGALLGFAGRRVIEGTIKSSLPDDFQTAEFALEHGLIDAIVERGQLRNTVIKLLAYHTGRTDLLALPEVDPTAPKILTKGEIKKGAHSEALQVAVKEAAAAKRAAAAEAAAARQAAKWSESANAQSVDGSADENLDDAAYTAWRRVQLARNTKRPTAQYYIEALFHDFIELHGDRHGTDDGAIVGGLAMYGDTPVTIISQEKGTTTAQRLARNFGCANPEGYRKALRLAHDAERFGRPIINIVDTQGAFCGVEAEERGQGEAIARCLYEFSTLRVPVISVLIGEGGSGGALALAVADRVAMLENAVYSVLSPEGFASILWKDGSKAKEAAQVMKMTAADAKVLGVVDEIIPEPETGAQDDPEFAAEGMREYLDICLPELAAMDMDQLLEARYQRYRKFF